MTDLAMPSANSWFGIRLLPGVLSLTAGSMDVIGLLGLGGLFTAHITGNLVIVAAHVVTSEATQWAAILFTREVYCGRYCLTEGQLKYVRWVLRANAEAQHNVLAIQCTLPRRRDD
jgi:Protein of unknown function (DUF1275)